MSDNILGPAGAFAAAGKALTGSVPFLESGTTTERTGNEFSGGGPAFEEQEKQKRRKRIEAMSTALGSRSNKDLLNIDTTDLSPQGQNQDILNPVLARANDIVRRRNTPGRAQTILANPLQRY